MQSGGVGDMKTVVSLQRAAYSFLDGYIDGVIYVGKEIPMLIPDCFNI